jgi:hypothetical protein
MTGYKGKNIITVKGMSKKQKEFAFWSQIFFKIFSENYKIRQLHEKAFAGLNN